MGNPGPRFAGTRHNAGFDAVETVAASHGLTFRKPIFRSYEWTGRSGGTPLVLVRPLTYMNRSGSVISGLLRRTRVGVESLLVVCDNLDLAPGCVRLKRKGNARSHNGLASIMDALGTGDFLRLYIGIGHPGARGTVVDHVLSEPEPEELDAYRSGIALAAWAVDALLHDSPDSVMNTLNRRG